MASELDPSREKPPPAVLPLLVGLLLGTLSRYSSRLSLSLRWLGNVGAIWLLVAFFVGRGRPSARSAALSGAIALSAAAVAHYLPYRLARFGNGPELLRHPLYLWIVVGAAAGALFGVLGFIQRHGSKPAKVWSAAVIMASLAGEAVLLFLVAPQYAYVVAAPVQLAAAAALPFILVTDRVKSFLTAAVMLPFCMAGLWLMIVTIGRVYPGL